jgi:hypothetical protein
MKLFRRIRAKLNGYFWLPCPLCSKMFAGSEAATETWVLRGQMVCWRCSDRVRKQNRQDFETGKTKYCWEGGIGKFIVKAKDSK